MRMHLVHVEVLAHGLQVQLAICWRRVLGSILPQDAAGDGDTASSNSRGGDIRGAQAPRKRSGSCSGRCRQ